LVGIIAAVATGIGSAFVQAGVVRHVDDGAPGGDGASWAGAYRFLQDALNDPAATEIRVAGGLYRPDQGAAVTPGDRAAAFSLREGVSLLGGYRGLAGGGDPNDRDVAAFESVLSGDLAGDDGPDFANVGENSLHVLQSVGGVGSRLLDGFTITGGNADGAGAAGEGGGLRHTVRVLKAVDCRFLTNRAAKGASIYAQGTTTQLELVRCELSGGLATADGGGLYSYSVIPTKLTGCTLADNTAASNGGAAYYRFGIGQVADCSITDNFANRGGGFYLTSSSPSFTDTLFQGNRTPMGVNQYGGGVYMVEGSSSSFTRCTFIDNHGSPGGGIAALYNYAAPTLRDCLFFGCSSASGGGGAVALGAGEPLLERCTFVGNSATYGGAVSNGTDAETLMRNCRFLGNTATSAGLGGGALYTSGRADLRGCFFSGNHTASNGGTLSLSGAAGVTALLSCTLAGNSAAGEAGGIYDGHVDHTVVIRDCILWNNTDSGPLDESAQLRAFAWFNVQVNFSIVQGWSSTFTGSNNSGANPQLADPDGPDGAPGTADDRPHLSAASPAINAGEPSFPSVLLGADLDGHTRVLCGRVDIGADEFGFADFNCNRVVNLADFAAWTTCALGPAADFTGAGCEAFDWDADENLDLRDFAGIQQAFPQE